MTRPPPGAPGRARAALAALAGAALVTLPTLPWYEVEVAGRARRATGLEGSGELWILPVLGGLALLVAATLLLAETGGAASVSTPGGLALIALGAMAAFWSIRNIVDPPVLLTIAAPGIDAPVAASVLLEPAALAAPPVAAALVLAGVALISPLRRRGRR